MAVKKTAPRKQDQRMVALPEHVKNELDEKLTNANEIRLAYRLSRLTRADLILLMLKKLTDKDCKSTQF